MSTLIDYVTRSSGHSFEEVAFNEIDGLVLAYAASFLHYTNVKNAGSVSFSELADEKGMRQFTSRPAHPDNYQLFKSMSRSKRYGEVLMINPIEVIKPNQKEKFRAIMYQLPNAKRVVAFKGSDSSFLSWEENCHMFLNRPLPAISSAVDYLKETIAASEHEYYIAGYSKGGHIAAAASLLLPENISERILAVYTYDGPGISHIEELEELSETASFEHHKFIPRESCIGALFEATENYQVVESHASGMDQHNPHTWKIQDDQFVRSPEISKKSAWLSRLANELIDTSEETMAMETIDYCFAILKNSDFLSFRDFKQFNFQKFRSIHDQRQALADEAKGYAPLELVKLFAVLLSSEVKSAASSMKTRKRAQAIAYKTNLTTEIKKLRRID